MQSGEQKLPIFKMWALSVELEESLRNQPPMVIIGLLSDLASSVGSRMPACLACFRPTAAPTSCKSCSSVAGSPLEPVLSDGMGRKPVRIASRRLTSALPKRQT